MYLSPSKIHFTQCLGEDTISELANEVDVDKLTQKYIEKGKFPKLQVAEKDGQFFTLNNTQLQIFRKLQEKGQCKTIKVEKVSLRRVPDGILKLMTITKTRSHSSSTETGN